MSLNTQKKLADSLNTDVKIEELCIRNQRINFITAGSGQSVLLIHGANFGWGVWYPNIAEIAKHFKVYAIDLPGAGRSARVDYSKLELKDLLDVLNDFIFLNKIKNFNIIGCSIGGWLALQIALSNPQVVKKIVVENSVGFSDSKSISDKVISIYPFAKLISRTFLHPSKRKNIEIFLRNIFSDKNIDLKKEFIDYFCETMESSHNLLFISRLLKLGNQLYLNDELKKLNAETLVIWGKDDKIMPIEKSISKIKMMPKVKIEIFENVGHIPSLESSTKFNTAVINFLKEVK